jgi:molybdopterin converting factor small subunit
MDDVQVTVKLYASFRIGRFTSMVREYPDHSTIASIAQDLGIPEEYLIRLRNGCHASPDEELHDGDTVSFLPMLEGG